MRDMLILIGYVAAITAVVAVDIAVMRSLLKRIRYLEYDAKQFRAWLGETERVQREIRSHLAALESHDSWRKANDSE